MKLLSINSHLKKKSQISPRNLKQLSQCLINNLEITLTSTISVQILHQSSTQSICFSTFQPSTISPYHYKIQLTVNVTHRKVIYRSTLIKNNSIFMINSHCLKVNLLQKIAKIITNNIQTFTRKIDFNTGQIDITLTECFGKHLFNNYNLLGKHIEQKIKELIRLWNYQIYIFLSQLNQLEKYQHQVTSRKSMTIQKIKRHIYFSQNDLGLSQKGNQHKCPGQETMKNRQLIIKSLLQCYDKSQIKEAFMYGQHKIEIKKDSLEWKKQFETPFYFDRLLQIPAQKQLAVGQNCHIHNKIEIIQPENIKSQEKMKTANSIIKVSTFTFKYTYNVQNDIKKGEGKQIIFKKELLIKTPKNDTPKQRNKLLHEKRIIGQLNTANSPYLLKYYTSEQKFQHKDDVIMDYNPTYLNLLTFISKRKESLCLESKLTILTHISNALRFLNYYKIVHMDLNPNNVLINDEYLPKIIDFGESYLTKLVGPEFDVKKLYNPGYTIPYCPPEVFFKKTFDNRQDAFSLGIIMFRVINDVLPYFPSDNVRNIYHQLNYHQNFFFAPQKFKNLAKYQVCHLLMLLQNRCLDQVCEKRPLPQWMTIIIRQIILYLGM